MIYTALCIPGNVLDACISITWGNGRGLGPGIPECVGPQMELIPVIDYKGKAKSCSRHRYCTVIYVFHFLLLVTHRRGRTIVRTALDPYTEYYEWSSFWIYTVIHCTVQTVCRVGVASLRKKKNSKLNFSLIYPTHTRTPQSVIWNTFQIWTSDKSHFKTFFRRGRLGTFTSVATADSPHLRNTLHLHCFCFVFHALPYNVNFVLARGQCCGSGTESGSTCFWTSRIRIH